MTKGSAKINKISNRFFTPKQMPVLGRTWDCSASMCGFHCRTQPHDTSDTTVTESFVPPFYDDSPMGLAAPHREKCVWRFVRCDRI